jgi:hypothetical protein
VGRQGAPACGHPPSRTYPAACRLQALQHQEDLTALRGLAAQARARQEALQQRLGRLGSIYSNLDERLRVLTTLHWSMPRPLSVAERDLSRQLDVWEGRQQELKLGWSALRARVDAVVQADQRARGAGGRSASGLLPAQQERFLRLLEGQHGTIREAEARLGIAEEEVTGWKVEHPGALLRMA